MRLAGQFACAFAMLALGGILFAQSGDAGKSAASIKPGGKASASPRGGAGPKRDAKGKSAIMVTPEREAAVMTFVQRNHAELAELLSYLKTGQQDEYERAIKEIFRTTERLAQIQERDPLQYELEVAAWTAQSRVQLWAARLKMGSSEELLKQLRDGLRKQNETKLSLLKHERKRAADRLQRIENDIARYESQREDVISKQLNVLTQAAEKGRPAKLPPKNAKPVKKNPPTK